MKLLQSEIAKSIRTYNVHQRKGDADALIAEARRFQKWTNSRIDALAKAGVPKNVSVGRMTKKKPTTIKTVKQAERAIARAKTIANNPLASVRNYKQVIRAGMKEYGRAAGALRVIANPDKPNEPIAVPRGTNGGWEWDLKTAAGLISDFWEWYVAIGQLYFDSKTAKSIDRQCARTGENPIEVGEQYIKDVYGEEVFENDYLTRLREMYNNEKASKIL